jgi:hypothetical protein
MYSIANWWEDVSECKTTITKEICGTLRVLVSWVVCEMESESDK